MIIDSNVTYENGKPEIIDLKSDSLFYLDKPATERSYEILLGLAFDPEGDDFDIEFDNLGYDFIRL